MSAAGAAVLIALFLLWRSTRSEALPVEPGSRPAPPAATPSAGAPVTPAAPAPGPAARVGKVGGSATAAPRIGTQAPTPTLTPAPESAPSDDPMSNNENLHFGGTQLRAQNAAVEPLVRECVDKAVASGLRPTGKALMTYVVAKQGDKYVIEDTSYDSDETTLQHPGLIECLHRTAKAMKFVGLPRRAHALVVTRSIQLENGAIREYKHVGFSYLR